MCSFIFCSCIAEPFLFLLYRLSRFVYSAVIVCESFELCGWPAFVLYCFTSKTIDTMCIQPQFVAFCMLGYPNNVYPWICLILISVWNVARCSVYINMCSLCCCPCVCVSPCSLFHCASISTCHCERCVWPISAMDTCDKGCNSYVCKFLSAKCFVK